MGLVVFTSILYYIYETGLLESNENYVFEEIRILEKLFHQENRVLPMLSKCSDVTKGFFAYQLELNIIKLIIERLAQESENS